MYCSKCKAEVMEDALFCPKCGSPVSAEIPAYDPEEMEKTMAIPLSKIRETEDRMVHRTQPAPKKVPEKPEPKPASKTTKPQNKNTALICAVVFLATVVVILGAALVIVLLKDNKPVETVTDTVSDKAETVIQKKTNEEENESKEEFPEGESVLFEEVTGVKIDTGFSFKTDAVIESADADYNTLKGSDYRCDVPSGFEFVYDSDGEIRYAEKNGTAYMDIGITENTDAVSMDEIKSKALSDIGGSVLSSDSGDNWYSVTVEKGSVIYHHKCIVNGGTVVYCELVYPSVYDELYRVYIEDIYSSFELI